MKLTPTPPPAPFSELTGPQQGWAYEIDSMTARHVADLRTAIDRDCRRALQQGGLPFDETALADLVVVVSELAGNVVKHVVDQPKHRSAKPGKATVVVALEGTDLLLTVIDSSGQGPLMDTTSPGEEDNGLGLRLVGLYTNSRWGWYPLGDGKAVWARCPLTTTTESSCGTDSRHPLPPSEATGRTTTVEAPAATSRDDHGSMTPAHDGAHWLTRTYPERSRDQPFLGWQNGGLASIPVRELFQAVVVSNDAHAGRAIDYLTDHHVRLGPIITHRPDPDYNGRTTFLVPAGAPWPPVNGTALLHPGAGHLIACPRPGCETAGYRWIVPPDGSGLLTDAGALAQALAATNQPTVPLRWTGATSPTTREGTVSPAGRAAPGHQPSWR